MTPRVLHVVQPDSGGVATYVVDVVSDQMRRGWDVVLAAPDRIVRRLDATPGRLRAFSWGAGREPGLRTLAELSTLHRIIRAAQPDVVHLHSSKAGLVGRLALRGAVPTIFQPHGWSWLAVEGLLAAAACRWERAAARWTDAIVEVGEGEAAQARERRLRGRHVIVRNGVDLERFRSTDGEARQAARRSLSLPADGPLAVCVGRTSRQKGQDVLLRAWSLVREVVPQATLALVGPVQKDGVRVPEEHGGRIRQIAEVTDIRPWYVAADVVVAPSRWEGLSLTALEALASGRSVVASDVPGLAESITADVGALVPPENVRALADAVARRLLDPSLAQREGHAAANRARSFDASRTRAELAELVLDVIAQRRSGPDRRLRTSD